jgi:hypothetical protein
MSETLTNVYEAEKKRLLALRAARRRTIAIWVVVVLAVGLIVGAVVFRSKEVSSPPEVFKSEYSELAKDYQDTFSDLPTTEDALLAADEICNEQPDIRQAVWMMGEAADESGYVAKLRTITEKYCRAKNHE